MSTLELRGVSAGYRDKLALQGVDLSLEHGLHVVLGPNGAGKTTLFRVVAGVLQPQSGTISLLGEDPHREPEAKRRVSYLMHRTALASDISVRDNLMFWSRVLGLSSADFERELERVNSELELADILECRVRTLSRGQAQRASVARALLANPLILLCDEPTNGLDPIAAEKLRYSLRLLAANGRLILYSTHNLQEASAIADNVIVLSEGRVRERGTIDFVASQLVGPRSYGIRAKTDLTPLLKRLGRPALRDGAFWLVDCRDEAELAEIVQACVRDGIMIYEARPMQNALERLYRKVNHTPGEALS